MSIDRGRPVAPPADLASRDFPLQKIPRGEGWWRIHRASLGPCYFSEDTGNRFSSSGLGVLYVADRRVTAFWEIFWDDLATRAPNARVIARAKLNQRALCSASLVRPINVFDATNATRLRDVGASAATFGGDYDNCQVWAKALYSHPSRPMGILYSSARDPGRACLALFASRTGCTDLRFGTSKPVGRSLSILKRIADDHVKVID
jgi:hypothetical protein